jgi:hypothetical protein
MPNGPRNREEALGVLKYDLYHLDPNERTAARALFNMRTQPAVVEDGNIVQPNKPKKHGGRSRRKSRRKGSRRR